MANKPFNSRIQLKHDTEAHWILAQNFSPLAGELIIYDTDATHSSPRFKVGDGTTNVNDLPFVTADYVETDPTVPAWAKAATKPTYTAAEVGALPDSTAIPTKTSELTNDSNFLTAHQDISGKADKNTTVSTVFYDTTNKKITKTINGTTSDVVSTATLKTDMSLNNVENKSSATIRSELTSKNVTDALGFTPTTNIGTVTSIATGAGLTGGNITENGTIKAKLKSETALTNDSAAATETSGRVYPVAVDKSGYLAVNVPWTDSKPVTSVAGKTGAVTLAKGDVGLGNVENKSSATIRSEITSSNVTAALGFTPLNAALKGANSGVAELDNNGKVPSSQLPSYVDDVLEYAELSSFPTTGEAGKIYIAQNTNKTYRWSGTAYVEISASLALGTTSSTAYRGDYGNAAYTHAVTNKGAAFASGFYKITTNSEGHVTAVTAVAKSDITALGIPASNTTYTFDGTYDASTNKAATVSTVTNAIAALGTIGAAAAKGVDTSIAASSTSTNIPTSQAVAAFVESKGYKTTDNNTTYSLTQDSTDGHKITLTPSSGTAQTITIPDNNTWRPVGTGASDAAAGNHTHTLSLATDTGTSSITLAHGGKYKLTAGGSTYIFTMPNDNNTNYYHTTGSWGGTNSLTYTATANGGAGTLAFTLPTASTDVYGATKLVDSVTNTSTTLAATANSVKTAYDLANKGGAHWVYATSNSSASDALTYDTAVTPIAGQIIFVTLTKATAGTANMTMKFGSNTAISIVNSLNTVVKAVYPAGTILQLVYANSKFYLLNLTTAL